MFTLKNSVMSQVGDVLDSVRCLLLWLERKQFDSKEEFYKIGFKYSTTISIKLCCKKVRCF